MKTFLLSVLLCQLLQAQQPYKRDFNKYVQDLESKFVKFESETRYRYENFHDTAHSNYAKYRQQQWEKVKVHQAIPFQLYPKASQPLVKDSLNQAAPLTKCLSIRNIQIPIVRCSRPSPAINSTAPVSSSPTLFSFHFYNTPCKVRLNDSQRINLPKINKKTVSAAWASLKTNQLEATLLDCFILRDSLALGDWGYIDFLKTLTEAFYGGACPEAVLMQTYLLTQSGYTTRLIKSYDHLYLTIPFLEEIYNLKYIKIDDTKFYIVDKSASATKYVLYDHESPKDAISSLYQSSPPILAENLVPIRTFTSKKYPSLFANITINRNLINFYTNYPISKQWQYYVITSLSNSVKKTLYPILKSHLEFKNQKEAVSILLNFVQTAFDYQSDNNHFKYERPLFGDEMFFYPFNDCEDRSILFAILVRELVGLDVVLLNYPNHLATAVKFTETQPAGSYFELQDGNYIICDPTYTNAGIGECMPQYRETSATIVRI